MRNAIQLYKIKWGFVGCFQNLADEKQKVLQGENWMQIN